MIKKVLCAAIFNTLWLIYWSDNYNQDDPGQVEQLENTDPLIWNPQLRALLWSFLERIILKLPKFPPCSTKWSQQVIINVGNLNNVRHLHSIISNPNNYSQMDLQALENFLKESIVSTKSDRISDMIRIPNAEFQNVQTQTKLITAINIVILVFELVLLLKSGFKNKKLVFAILASLSSSIIMIVCNHLQDVQFMLINFSWEIGLSFCLIIIILVTIYNFKLHDESNITTTETEEDVLLVKEDSLDPLYSSNDLHSEVSANSANNDLGNSNESLDQIDFVFEPPFMSQIPSIINESPVFQERKRNVSEQSSSSSISQWSTFSQFSTFSRRQTMFPSCLSRKLPALSMDGSLYPLCSSPLSTSKISEISSDTDELD